MYLILLNVNLFWYYFFLKGVLFVFSIYSLLYFWYDHRLRLCWFCIDVCLKFTSYKQLFFSCSALPFSLVNKWWVSLFVDAYFLPNLVVEGFLITDLGLCFNNLNHGLKLPELGTGGNRKEHIALIIKQGHGMAFNWFFFLKKIKLPQ